ncbi:polysaccharide deacetylase family protein [Dethiobacter alkaliphilus]|uniref:polysaccharide deacetylase family protein n=1 Tax=Dethiobacter alkaliphilus TaxID=427926 RepID=UPI0022268FD1|nr:polysaccharide deacetylase family protein [Dethiobacter alkaliphilus]MCW3489528.1 polysaccharide deacetylase [Dethiobacter alkaliphilus]
MSNRALLITAAVIVALLLAGGSIGMIHYNKQFSALKDEVRKVNRHNHTLREQNTFLKNRVNELEKDLAAYQLPDKEEKPQEEESFKEEEQPKAKQPQETKQKPQENHYGGSGPTAYLTFDDGPSKNTLAILEILKQENIPATFFVTGNNVSGEESVYKRIVNEGHRLANHTYTHNFAEIYQSTEAFLADFLRLEEFLYQETGIRTDMMRFPGGTKSAMAQKTSGYNIVGELIGEIKALDYDYFDWNVYSGDGTDTPPSAEIVKNVLSGADGIDGDIVVLFHDSRTKKSTVEALPQIIAELTERGYSFSALSPGAIEVKHK